MNGKQQMIVTRRKSGVLAGIIACILAPSALAETTSIQNTEAGEELLSEEISQLMETVEPMPFYDEASDPNALPSHLYNLTEEAGPPGFAPGGPAPSTGNEFGETLEEDTTDPSPSTDFESGTNFGTVDEGDYFAASKAKWNNKKYPWNAVGKLLIATTTPDDFNSSCSASVISENDIIVTAAHCCYDRGTGQWFADWRFVPGAHKSDQPFGSFDWTNVRVLNDWVTSGGRQNDVCVISLGQNSNGETVSSLTGWLGRSWNQPQTVHVFTFGYPGNVKKGKQQAVCVSENYPNCGSTTVNATGCNKTYGDSGGPWIRVYRPRESGASNFVNSVTSGHDGCTGTFGASYNGARFTDANIVPLCNDEGC